MSTKLQCVLKIKELLYESLRNYKFTLFRLQVVKQDPFVNFFLESITWFYELILPFCHVDLTQTDTTDFQSFGTNVP